MQTTELVSNFGAGISYRKFTITPADLKTTPTAITLFTLPQGAAIMGVIIHNVTAFSGGTLAVATVSVGVAGTVTAFSATLNCFTAGSDTAVLETPQFKHGQNSAVAVIANVIFTGDVAANVTAGQVDVYICFLNVTSPLA